MIIIDQIYWSQVEPTSKDCLWIHSIKGIYHIQVYENSSWHDLTGECNNIDVLLQDSQTIATIKNNITDLQSTVIHFKIFKSIDDLPVEGSIYTLYLVQKATPENKYKVYDKYIYIPDKEGETKYERLDTPIVTSIDDYTIQNLIGVQDDSNVLFSTENEFKLTTSRIYLNGVRLFLNEDYVEENNQEIKFLTYVPKSTDKLKIEAQFTI